MTGLGPGSSHINTVQPCSSSTLGLRGQPNVKEEKTGNSVLRALPRPGVVGSLLSG